MKLFPEETVITGIHAVMCYGPDNQPEDEWRTFGVPYCYELVYYLDGENETFFQGQVFQCTADCMLLLPKGAPDPGYRVHRLSSYVGRCIDVYFETATPMPERATFFQDCGSEMRGRFLKLYHTWSGKSGGYYTRSMSLFYQIIALQIHRELTCLSPAGKLRMQAVSTYIGTHYLDPNFDYPALAQVSGLSYSQFKKQFVKFYGVPPVKYVTRLRMEYARELLLTGNYSVSQVAERCGYGDIYYFSAVFKRVFGVSPSTYQKKRSLP